MQTMIERFQQAITDAGLQSPQTLIADGKIHRFSTNGKVSDRAGWYLLHLNGFAAGAFGDWRTGFSQSWCSKDVTLLSQAERELHRTRTAEIKAQRETERKLREAEGRERALSIWQESEPAGEEHPYLIKKEISVHGVRESRGKLVIPVLDASGLQSLQFIDPNGNKRFLTGGSVSGCYFAIGLHTRTILVAEGFATAASLHEATGRMVVVAFSVENLQAVCNAIRSQFPTTEIIVCADDDFTRTPNIGLTKASNAAKLISAKLAIPIFSKSREESDTDFNDMRRIEGDEAIRNAVELACPVSHCSTEAEWPEPEPINAELRVVPKFDPDILLPSPLREFVMDAADRMPCPPEFVAVSLLVSIGSVIGASCAIKPKQHDDWQVVPNLWGNLVGEPASKKSPAMDAALKPLDALAEKARQKYLNQKTMYDQAIRAHESRRKEFEKKLRDESGKLKKGEFDKELDEMARLASALPTEPKLRRYKTNDATIEKLIEILQDNPKGILNLRDELAGILDTFEKAGREGDRSFFLEGWNGQRDFNTDRIIRGSVHATNVCLSILGGIQPERLLAHLGRSVKSLSNDGLVQRFQLMVFPDPAQWEYRDREPDRAAQERVVRLFEQLADFDPLKMGAIPLQGSEKFPSFRFSPEAQFEYARWSRKLNTEIIPREDDRLIQQHLGKYEKLVPSLSLIFHLVECFERGANEFVSIESVCRAIAWSEFLEPHIRRVYGLLLDDGLRSARALSKRIESGRLEDGFTAREIKRANLRELTSDKEVNLALEWLEADGWILGEVQRGTGPGGGRRTIRYRINPKIRHKNM